MESSLINFQNDRMHHEERHLRTLGWSIKPMLNDYHMKV
jgi:hypothetical protein